MSFDALCDRLASLFGRKEIRNRSRSYFQALIRPVERKNGWQIAVERLLAMIEGAPVSECRITLLAELIVRASTVGR